MMFEESEIDLSKLKTNLDRKELSISPQLDSTRSMSPNVFSLVHEANFCE